MTRPLALDFLLFLGPVVVGIFAAWLGGVLVRRSRGARVGMMLVSIAALVLAGFALREQLPIEAATILTRFGGGGLLACCTALLLLGAARQGEKSSFSPKFLRVMCLIALGLVIEESGASLWWRFGQKELWNNKPDSMGRIRQRTGTTCAPTAAAMLLHKYGVTSSEGEMAYWSGTSMFGTDTYSTAYGVNRRLPEDKRAVVIEANYDTCLNEGKPFLASVYLDRVGWHAVLVTRATIDGLDLYDPLTEGTYRQVTRAMFDDHFRKTIIVIRDA